jgi:alpha-L-fucosidase
LWCFLFSLSCTRVKQQELVIPTKAQIEWADAEIGALICYDIMVFQPEFDFRRDMGKHPDPALFNPSEISTDQWIEAVSAAGAKYAILTAKWCTGHCLWPTKAHEYSIKNSPWKKGEGDLVSDFITSCKKYGLKPGIYYSTAANGYLGVDNPGKVVSGDPEEQKRYNEIVVKQLTELWTEYGDMFEVWFDGGVLPADKGGIDILSMLRKYQPEAIAFQGPFGYENNIRWVGNEIGVAPYPCWATADSSTSSSGVIEIKGLNGNPDGLFWCPGEADFPLRWNSSFQGGWFWKKGEDHMLFTLDELMVKYDYTVGRNTNMLIGVVIDDRGLVPDPDVTRLKEFGHAMKQRFSNKLGVSKGKGKEFVIDLRPGQKVNCVIISEEIQYGERIRKYQLEGMKENVWVKISEGESVGHKRIENFPADAYTKIRLSVTDYKKTPIIKTFECYMTVR